MSRNSSQFDWSIKNVGSAVRVLQAACRFGFVGAIASLVHLSVAAVALGFGLHVMAANTVGFCSGLIVSVFGHHTFSFPGARSFWRGARRFVPVAILAFVANNVVLAALFAATNSSHAWIKVAIAILIIPPVTFGYSYLFAYRD